MPKGIIKSNTVISFCGFACFLVVKIMLLCTNLFSLECASVIGLDFYLDMVPFQVGISVAARKYDFNAATPFETSDILNLQPVVKHSVPVCSEAKNLVEMGKVQLAEVSIMIIICS